MFVLSVTNFLSLGSLGKIYFKVKLLKKLKLAALNHSLFFADMSLYFYTLLASLLLLFFVLEHYQIESISSNYSLGNVMLISCSHMVYTHHKKVEACISLS